MIALLRLCRFYYALPMAAAFLLTIYYARGGRMESRWTADLVAAGALMLVIAAAYVLNDVLDCHIDRVNAPGRPLPSGAVRRSAALAWGIVLMIGGVVVASQGRPQFLAALAAVAVVVTCYDLLSKRLGLLKQVLVSVLMASIYPLAVAQAGWPVGSRAGALAFFPVWLLLTSFGYEILKDIRDARGDMAAVAAPSPVQRRPDVWRIVSRGAILAGAAFLVGPFVYGCGWVYVAGAAGAGILATVSAFLPVRRALRLVYAECVLVGLAATLDVIVLGF
ncbi:MAG TPA: UbiA family prenyltransferase [Phycisphaerae bacterium]|nr:UbiA family prenyltransferase [Phycisphaerae bacterium]HOI53717.1 UbiA family prenyltransferase [Phycisphaerae bacterium]